MTKSNPELRAIDAEMGRLRARRKLVVLRERFAQLQEHVTSLHGQLADERKRTTPDSVTAITDTRLATLLAEARAENTRLRADAAKRAMDTMNANDIARLHEANRTIEQLRNQRQAQIETRGLDLASATKAGMNDERIAVVGWLRREAAGYERMADHPGDPVKVPARVASDILSNAALQIEKGTHREPR